MKIETYGKRSKFSLTMRGIRSSMKRKSGFIPVCMSKRCLKQEMYL